MAITLNINDRPYTVDVEPERPLSWVSSQQHPPARTSRRKNRNAQRGGKPIPQKTPPRRKFIQVSAAPTAGGLMLGFHIPVTKAAVTGAKPITKMPEGVEINAWLS